MIATSVPGSLGKAPGTSTKQNALFENRLTAYAAGAAGMALLAAASPGVQAEIVYTPTNVNILPNLPYPLDVDGDGTVDFEFFVYPLYRERLLEIALEVQGNAVKTDKKGNFAGALFHGAPIGPKQPFVSANISYGGVFMANQGSYGTFTYSAGPWVQTTDRYLGLKFLIHNEVHYGWARLSVTKGIQSVILSGYAYETVPNKPLRAGQTTRTFNAEATPAPPHDSRSEAPTLGLLARGAQGLAIWRRDEGEE